MVDIILQVRVRKVMYIIQSKAQVLKIVTRGMAPASGSCCHTICMEGIVMHAQYAQPHVHVHV